MSALLFWNLIIFNIMRWVAGSMGQTSHRPSVWCSKHYFFSIISHRLRELKTLYFNFCKFTKNTYCPNIYFVETGMSPGWKQHGGLSITADEDRLKEFKLIILKILNREVGSNISHCCFIRLNIKNTPNKYHSHILQSQSKFI